MSPAIELQPVVSLPERVALGQRCLLTVDLRQSAPSAWPYPQEEIEVSCFLDSSPWFSHEPIGRPAVVLHRFGGTYGPARWVLTPKVAVKGELRVTLFNPQGVPMLTLTPEIEVVEAPTDLEPQDLTKQLKRDLINQLPENLLEPREEVDLDSHREIPSPQARRPMHEQVWTDELLDQLRQIGDPVADDVVARYFKENEMEQPRRLMGRLVDYPVVRDKTRTPAVDAYHMDTPHPPPWANAERMRRGAEVFAEWGLLFVTSLFCASLPQAYAAAKSVQVLHMTTRLASDTQRRIYETAQMVIDVMTPGYLEPGQPGYYDARQVRLMHAAVRHLIRHDPVVVHNDPRAKSIRWMDEWGVPINQEDLLGTLMTFTVVSFESLRRFGIELSKQDAEDYLLTWNVVGYLLGIREDLLPIELDSANELWAAFRRRHWAHSPEGAEMTGALVRLLRSHMPSRMRHSPSSLIRYLSGDEVGDMLEIEPAQRIMGSFLARRLGATFARVMLQSLFEADRGEIRASFSIPDNLVHRWRVRG